MAGGEERASDRVLIPVGAPAPKRPPGDRIETLGGETMGTTWRVRYVAPPGLTPEDARAAVQAELDGVIALFSPWEPSSEVSRFNSAPAGMWAVSTGFWSLLDAAMDIADETNGAVDPTLGALVDLWGFGPPGPVAAPPSDEAVAEARAVSGWQGLRLSREHRGVMQVGGMKLDFSAIAKGHAVDRVSARLVALGASSHLVEIGGELKGVGVKPDAQPWWVEIEAAPGNSAPRTVAALFDLAVATSGDYRRAFEHEGTVYSHTVDGATGRPIGSDLAAVTVFHASAMRADALATALYVMGPVDGPGYAEAVGLAACFTERTPQGLVERMTPAWTAMMDEGA